MNTTGGGLHVNGFVVEPVKIELGPKLVHTNVYDVPGV
jgi:hypothetical protein